MSSPSDNRTLRRIRNALSALLLIVVLVIGTGLVLRDQLTFAALRVMLTNYGIALHEIEGLQWGTTQVRFDSLSMTLPGAESASLVEGLHIRFVPRELLQGRLQEVSVARATLHVAESDAESSGARKRAVFTAPDLASAVATLMQFPIASTRIDTLTLTPWLNEAALSLVREPRELVGIIDVDELHGELRANWHDTDFVSSYFIPEAELDLHGMATGTITGSLQLQSAGNTALHAEFSALQTSEGLALDAVADTNLADMAGLAQRAYPTLTKISGLTGKVALRLQSSLSSDSGKPLLLALHVDPTQIQVPLGPDLLLLGIDHLSVQGQCSSQEICSLTQSSAVHLTSLPSPAAQTEQRFNGVHLTSTSEVEIAEGEVQVEIAAASVFALDELLLDKLQLRNVNVAMQEPLSIRWDGADELALQSTGITLSFPDIGMNETRSSALLEISELAASGALSTKALTDLDAKVRLHGWSSNAMPFVLREPELIAQIAIADSQASMTGELRVANRPAFEAAVSFDLNEATGTAELSVPAQTYAAGTNTFANLFVSPSLGADIVAGSIKASASLQLHMDEDRGLTAEGPLNMQMSDLSGFVGETAIVGLNASLQGELQDDYSLRTTVPIVLTAGSIDPGIAIQDIHAQIEVDTRNDTLNLTNLEATLFNGKARSEGGTFALREPQGTLTLQLEAINLTSVLALGAYEGVTASGFVSGSLPVSIRDGAVSIAGGELHAQSPGGSIRYTGSSGATGNAALDFVNQTLGNYQYDVMDAGVDYAPDGDLSLSLKLQGVNPDNNPGQRINLNLNISDNIPTLLRSLQAGRTITDAIEQQLQNR